MSGSSSEAYPPTSSDEQDTSEIFRHYAAILWKRKWLVAVMLVLVVTAVSAWTFTRQKIYASTARLLFEQRAPQVLGKDVGQVVELSMGSFWKAKEFLKTQQEVIQSKMIAEKVAEDLNLVHDETFWPPRRTPQIEKPSLDDAAGYLASLVKAQPVKGTNLMAITVRHHNAEMAKKLANATTDAFVKEKLHYRASVSVFAVKWLADQLDDLRKKLETSEQKLHDFKRENNVISVSFEDKQNLISSRITRLNEALTDLNLKQVVVQAQRKEARKARSEDPFKVSLPIVVNSTGVQALKTTYKDEQRTYQGLLGDYGDKHPKVIKQRARLEAARGGLAREVKTLLNSVENRYRQLRQAEGQNAAILQTAKKTALDLNQKQLVYQRLKREQVNAAKLYGSVLTRLRETDLTSQLKSSNMRILQPAEASWAAVSPRVTLNLAMAVFLGLLLGVGLVLLVEVFDTTVKSRDDLAGQFTFLGAVPRIPGMVGKQYARGKRPAPNPEFDLTLHRKPKSSYAESWRA
ncbi:MAG: GumC family protein, partial [Deltaproteobacteria bacterium]|nr:GumC family protein [Deltaproteobacteria bacterium]